MGKERQDVFILSPYNPIALSGLILLLTGFFL